MPTKGDDRQKWIDAIQINQQYDIHAQRFSICELHFLPESINRQNKKNHLEKGVAPSIFPIKETYV